MPPPNRKPQTPLFQCWLYLPQIHALLAAVDLDHLPDSMGGVQRAVLRRAITRLAQAAGRRPTSPLDVDLERLADVVLDIRSAEARELLTSRVHALTTAAVLWSAAEQLAPGPEKTRLLDLDLIDSTAWPADVLDALEAGRMRVTLPGDPERWDYGTGPADDDE